MQIDIDKCVGCGGCVNLCPQTAIYFSDNKAVIDQFMCTECRTCVFVCGMGAPGVSCRFPHLILFAEAAGCAGGKRNRHIRRRNA
ncbi:MAG: 4Fe-4S binding protein [Deltaproteobacteria bacterium]|nr:4Fe-4S binding protein [Deltaproteobacteria bacterium]